jgi:hypothetical protein
MLKEGVPMNDDSAAEPIPPSASPPRAQPQEASAIEKVLDIEVYDTHLNLQDVAPQLSEVFPCK